MNSYNLKEIEDIFNKVHPRKIVSKVENLNFTMHKVRYEYTTSRGNKKEKEMYFVLDTLNPNSKEQLQKELNEWEKNYNSEYTHRQISNVHFLGSQCVGFLRI